MSGALHPLDEATRLSPLSEGRRRGATHPLYANMAGPFGGVTAAVLLNAVLTDPRRLGDPIALTVSFCGAVAEGAFELQTGLQRGGKTTQHWSVELAQNGAVAATASVVCGVRKPGWSHYPGEPPPAPAPAQLPLTPGVGWPEWTRRYAFRFVDGGLDPFPRRDGRLRSPRTLAYIEDLPARPLDFLALAAMSDAFFVRILHVRGALCPMATVTLTTYFHIGADELAALGAAPILGEADAAVFHNGFADQTCALWAPGGRLVANGVQMTWYKD